MRANEFLFENYDLTKARIEHPEDMVFTNGSAGAKFALAAIQQMITRPETISIKPDGKPALVWGRDEQGFGLADKYMFNKGTIPRNPQQMAQIYADRKGGGREELAAMMAALWPQFEVSLSSGFKGWLMGDLLYSQTPPIENGRYVFQPNTVKYEVDVNSDIGKRIAASTSGIVAHSYFAAPLQAGQHITQLRGVNVKGPLLVLTDQFLAPPRLKTPADVKSITSFVSQNSTLIDKLLEPGALSALKIKDLPALFQKYANFRVRQRSFDGFGNDFLEWLSSSAGVTPNKVKNITTHLEANRNGYKVAMQSFIAIMKAKDALVDLLDKQPAPLNASIEGQPGQEGYIVHTSNGPVKMVNRLRFSAANF